MSKENYQQSFFFQEIKLKDFSLEPILPFCTRAPFGDLRSESTRFDPAVRRALEAGFKVLDEDSYTVTVFSR
jgi:hypothetical protein